MNVDLMFFLVKGVLAGLTISIPLGPIGVLLINRTVNKGIRSGFASGLGIATADTFYALVAAFGLSFLTNFMIKQQLSLKLIGGASLLYMGWRIYNKNPFKLRSIFSKECNEKCKGSNILVDFFSMFALTITNPFTVVFYGTIFTVLGFTVANLGVKGIYVVAIGIYLGAAIWWLVLSSGINLFRNRLRLRGIWLINKIMGGLIIALALIAAVSIFVKF